MICKGCANTGIGIDGKPCTCGIKSHFVPKIFVAETENEQQISLINVSPDKYELKIDNQYPLELNREGLLGIIQIIEKMYIETY